MSHKDEVEKLLTNSEIATGNRVQFAVSAPQFGRIGDVQINVYPAGGEAQVRTFNLVDGLTPAKKKEILEWFEPLALLTFRGGGRGV
jgi:hypothetical protein